jgi:hypothetical protein
MKEDLEVTKRRNSLEQGTIDYVKATLGFSLISELSACWDTVNKLTVRLPSPSGRLVVADEDVINLSTVEIPFSAHKVRGGIKGKKRTMLFDLSKCKGAEKCMSVSSKMHYLPPERSYIIITKMQDSEFASAYRISNVYSPCDNPPCVKVCSVEETFFKQPDGVTSCSYGGIYFGDQLEDAVTIGKETVLLSKLLKDKLGYKYLEEMGTESKVYSHPTNRMFPFENREFDKSQYQ